MAKHGKLPPVLKEHLQRLERLRLELARSGRPPGWTGYLVSHANGVLAMCLVIHVVHEGLTYSLGWWSLLEILAAAAGAVVACSGLNAVYRK